MAPLAAATPAGAYAAVDFYAPAQGTTMSGVIKAGPECEVWASNDTTEVTFYLDRQYVRRESDAPWNCNFDTREFSDGEHRLSAIARDTAGRTSSTSARIYIANGGGSGEGRPGGGGAMSSDDAEAASQVQRSPWEPRPDNWTPNHRVPTSAELGRFYAADSWGNCQSMRTRITGNFTGTTDEIIQWAAYKWGIDVDLMRAVAVRETSWNQWFRGDPNDGGSYGIMQVKARTARGSYPLSQQSTAFGVDYFAATHRYYRDGCAAGWMNGQYGNGRSYTAGDTWGSIGAWYSGAWWDWRAAEYISNVQNELWNRRTWARADF